MDKASDKLCVAAMRGSVDCVLAGAPTPHTQLVVLCPMSDITQELSLFENLFVKTNTI